MCGSSSSSKWSNLLRPAQPACVVSLAFSGKFDLHGRGAIVTGGSEGIGRAIVVTLLELGASVVTCGRSADKLAKLEAEIGPGADLKCLSLDVAVPSGREELVSQVRRLYSFFSLPRFSALLPPRARRMMCST